MKRKVQVPSLPPLRMLRTVTQMSELHPCWTPPAIRALILNSRDRVNSRGETIPGNGLDEAIVRVGRKVLIDEPKFIEIIAEQSKRARAESVRGRTRRTPRGRNHKAQQRLDPSNDRAPRRAGDHGAPVAGFKTRSTQASN